MYLPTTVVLRTVVDDRSIPCTPTGGLQVGPVVLPTNRDRRTNAVKSPAEAKLRLSRSDPPAQDGGLIRRVAVRDSVRIEQ